MAEWPVRRRDISEEVERRFNLPVRDALDANGSIVVVIRVQPDNCFYGARVNDEKTITVHLDAIEARRQDACDSLTNCRKLGHAGPFGARRSILFKEVDRPASYPPEG